MEIITTNASKAVPLTTESPIFTTEFRPIEATGHRKKIKSIPSSLEYDAALKALSRTSSASTGSLEIKKSAESRRSSEPQPEAPMPAKLLENIRSVSRNRKADDGELDGEEEGADPPEQFSKPVEPIKNFTRSLYARPPVGVPRNFNRSRISSVGTEGRSTNGTFTPKPPTSVNPSTVKSLTIELTKSLAEAVSNLTDKTDREPSQRWKSPKTSDENVEMISPEDLYTFGGSKPKTPPIKEVNGILTREIGRLEKALTDVENAPTSNGNMGRGWSRLKSNLAVATRINASDRVRNMAAAAASAALLRKSMTAEPTKVPAIVKELAHAAAQAAAIKKQTENEKEKDGVGPSALNAVRPPSRSLPPDERPVSIIDTPTNEMALTAPVRAILPGIKRATSDEVSETEEKTTHLRSALKKGSFQTGSTSSLENIEPVLQSRRQSKLQKNITPITNTQVEGDTILGVPSQSSDPGYAALRTPHQRLAEQTTLAARVRIDAVRERKENLDILREGGTVGGKDNPGHVKQSAKAEEVTKRLTNPTAFTGVSKVRFERPTETKPPVSTAKKPPAKKIDFFNTFDNDDTTPRMRRQVSASMSTLDVLPPQIPGATSTKKSSNDFSMPKLAGSGEPNNLVSRSAAFKSEDALGRRRTSSNEASRELAEITKSDETLRSERRKNSLAVTFGQKSSKGSLRGSSGSLEEESNGMFGMQNRYWPTEEEDRDAIAEDEEAKKIEKRRKKKIAKESTNRLMDKSNYTGVHRFGSMNRLAPHSRSPWNVI